MVECGFEQCIYTEREFYMPLRITPVCLQADNSLISVYIDSSYMVRIFELATTTFTSQHKFTLVCKMNN